MMDWAYPIFSLPVHPEGSNRVWAILPQSTSSGTPCCSDTENCVAKDSINPLIVDPCLDILMKISPGLPFG
jgi:hypothetical protein